MMIVIGPTDTVIENWLRNQISEKHPTLVGINYSGRTRERRALARTSELLQQRVSARKGQKSKVYSVRLNILSSVFMGADILFPDWYCWGQSSAFPTNLQKKIYGQSPWLSPMWMYTHLASRKIPCENISLTKLFKTNSLDDI